VRSTTNSDATNHEAENKKQDIYQIGGALLHRGFFPLGMTPRLRTIQANR
jgi:hypothetical protein